MIDFILISFFQNFLKRTSLGSRMSFASKKMLITVLILLFFHILTLIDITVFSHTNFDCFFTNSVFSLQIYDIRFLQNQTFAIFKLAHENVTPRNPRQADKKFQSSNPDVEIHLA